jgi:hypothetical protein
MLTLPRRAAETGFSEKEFTLGATSSGRRRSLLDSYLLNMGNGPAAIHEMMVADLRRWIDLGAISRAADVAIVLRQFVSDYPQAAFALHNDEHGNACVSDPPCAERRRCATTRRAHSSRVVISLAGRLRQAEACSAERRAE